MNGFPMIGRLATARLAAVVLLASARPAMAQQLGVGSRTGTLGLGAELAVGVTRHLAVRGGIGFFPVEPKQEFSDLEFTVELPGPLTTLGVDFYPTGGGFRLVGGILFGAETTTIEGTYLGQVEIGGREYLGQDLGELVGVFTTSNAAPFAGIGFGRHTGGFGLTVDLAAAFLGDPGFTVQATENNAVTSSPEFQADLAQEEAAILEDLDRYARVFPVLNIGLRFKVGG